METKNPRQVAKAVIRVHLLLLLFAAGESISGRNNVWLSEATLLSQKIWFCVIPHIKALGENVTMYLSKPKKLKRW